MFKQHLIRRSLAAALVVAGASFPVTAQALVIGDPLPAGGATETRAAPQVTNSDSPFQWGDAGIGAGGAAVLLGTAALGARVTRRRRHGALS
jgi:hypothetical protein